MNWNNAQLKLKTNNLVSLIGCDILNGYEGLVHFGLSFAERLDVEETKNSSRRVHNSAVVVGQTTWERPQVECLLKSLD